MNKVKPNKNAQHQAYVHAMGLPIWQANHIKTTEEPSKTTDALTWDALATGASVCQQCQLHKTRTQVVWGQGKQQQPELLVIGEAPGAEEDRTGVPFVGRAGQLLTAMLQAIGFARQDVYIANIIKCRPPNNRDPAAEEINTCSPYLVRQIKLLTPRTILAVGRFAAHFLLQRTEMGSLQQLRGKIHHYQKIPLIVTYHPAYLLRNPQDKRKTYDDLLLLNSIVKKKDE